MPSEFAPTLLVIETHPVQYRVPVYRALQAKWGVKVHIIYGSDFGLAPHFDKYFQTRFAWDVDLLGGIEHNEFLGRSAEGGARTMDELSAKGLRQAIRKANADAILVTGYWPAFHLHALYHALRSGLPVFFRAETTRLNGIGTLKGRVRDSVLRQVYSRCARLLPIGEWSRGHYRHLGCPEQKLISSPYCVDTKPFRWDEPARLELRREARAELGIADDRIVIVFSGKIYGHKRPLMLLEAIRLLPEGWRGRIEVLLVGSGPDLEAVRADAALEPQIRITCTGFKQQAELSRYYHASDLLVLPSRSETWGLVINEALLHGLPCVVTDTVGCAPDLMQPGVNGEIAEGSAGSLASAIAKALPLTGNVAVRAQCRASVNKYTLERAADGIFQALRETTQSAKSAEKIKFRGASAKAAQDHGGG